MSEPRPPLCTITPSPKQAEQARDILVSDWVGCMSESGENYQRLAGKEWQEILDWILGLSTRDAYRVLRSIQLRRKVPFPSTSSRDLGPWSKWLDYQYRMEGSDRGEAKMVDAKKKETVDWKSLATPAEVERIWTPEPTEPGDDK